MNVSEDNVAEKTRTSVKWSFSLQIVQKAFFFAVGIILARLLTPEDFGLAAMAMTLDGIMWLFLSFGVGAAVIHYQDYIEERLNAAFWFINLSSLIFFGLMMLSAPIAAKFYHEPILKDIIQVSAYALIINGLGAVPKTVMIKNIDFKSISIVEASMNTFRNLLYVVFALMGFKVWSFIYPKIIYAVFSVIYLWKASNWKPDFKPYFQYWGEMINYGKSVVLSNVLDYTLSNSSYIFIGGMVGATALGLFSFAYDKSMFVVTNISYPLTMIAFPTYSQLQNSPVHLKNTFVKALTLISTVSFFYASTQIAVGHEYIMTLFGPKWQPAVILFQMIVVYSMVRAIIQCGTPLLQGVGKPEIVLKWNLCFAPAFLGSIFLGYKAGGLFGITIGMCITGLISCLLYLKIICAALKWNFPEILNSLTPSLVSSLIVGIIMLLENFLLRQTKVLPVVNLIVVPGTGLLLYILCLKLFFVQTFELIETNIRKLLKVKIGTSNELEKA